MIQPKRFGRCLIIDDDPDILLSARLLLRDLFREVADFQSPEDALAAMDQELPDVVLLDANFGRGATNAAEGFHWLAEILKRDPQAVVVMITAHAGIQIAVEAMKRGATDFVSKPWSNERLLATVRTAAALRTTREEAVTERKRVVAVGAPAAGGEMALLGRSPAMARVYSLVERAAPTEANVLILGENGTGLLAPTGITCLCSSAVSSLGWRWSGRLPISSRNRVPPFAACIRPIRSPRSTETST